MLIKLNKQKVKEDSAWQVQRRVPQEIVQQYQPERINIPEFGKLTDTKVKRKLIIFFKNLFYLFFSLL